MRKPRSKDIKDCKDDKDNTEARSWARHLVVAVGGFVLGERDAPSASMPDRNKGER